MDKGTMCNPEQDEQICLRGHRLQDDGSRTASMGTPILKHDGDLRPSQPISESREPESEKQLLLRHQKLSTAGTHRGIPEKSDERSTSLILESG